MKAFSSILHELNEGSTHAALTADLAELLRTVQTTGRMGTLVLKIKIAPASRVTDGRAVEKVNITAEGTLNLPKREAPVDFFYLTEDGQTSRNHPKQQSLELREVKKPDAESVVSFKTVA